MLALGMIAGLRGVFPPAFDYATAPSLFERDEGLWPGKEPRRNVKVEGNPHREQMPNPRKEADDGQPRADDRTASG